MKCQESLSQAPIYPIFNSYLCSSEEKNGPFVYLIWRRGSFGGRGLAILGTVQVENRDMDGFDLNRQFSIKFRHYWCWGFQSLNCAEMGLCFDPFIALFFYLLYLCVCQWLTSNYYTMGLPGLFPYFGIHNSPKWHVLRSAVCKTHDLGSDLWWTIPLHILLDRFILRNRPYPP